MNYTQQERIMQLSNKEIYQRMMELKSIRDGDMLTGGSYRTTRAGDEFALLQKEWDKRFGRADAIDDVLCEQVACPIVLGDYEIRIWRRPADQGWSQGWAGRVYHRGELKIGTPTDWAFLSPASVINAAVGAINQDRSFNV